jgi:hypothetical protein
MRNDLDSVFPHGWVSVVSTKIYQIKPFDEVSWHYFLDLVKGKLSLVKIWVYFSTIHIPFAHWARSIAI